MTGHQTCYRLINFMLTDNKSVNIVDIIVSIVRARRSNRLYLACNKIENMNQNQWNGVELVLTTLKVSNRNKLEIGTVISHRLIADVRWEKKYRNKNTHHIKVSEMRKKNWMKKKPTAANPNTLSLLLWNRHNSRMIEPLTCENSKFKYHELLIFGLKCCWRRTRARNGLHSKFSSLSGGVILLVFEIVRSMKKVTRKLYKLWEKKILLNCARSARSKRRFSIVVSFSLALNFASNETWEDKMLAKVSLAPCIHSGLRFKSGIKFKQFSNSNVVTVTQANFYIVGIHHRIQIQWST